ARPLPRTRPKPSPPSPGAEGGASAGGDRLSVVRTMVAVCLLELVPFTEIDSAALLRRLENDQSSATPAEKAALADLGGDVGPISAVEMALRRIAEESGGVQLEEFTVNGKTTLMIWCIDRNKLLKELPESSSQGQQPPPRPPSTEPSSSKGNSQSQAPTMAGVDHTSMTMPSPSPDMWMGPPDTHLGGMPHLFPGSGGPPLVGPRGAPRVVGMMGIPRMMGFTPLQRPLMGPGNTPGGPNLVTPKQSSEEDDLKDLEALLNKKTFRELQMSKTGEELLDLIHRPTAKETAVAAKVWIPHFSLLLLFASYRFYIKHQFI
ncbi:hypothetical protein B296_00050337, partial [Ensete ventricosum]